MEDYLTANLILRTKNHKVYKYVPVSKAFRSIIIINVYISKVVPIYIIELIMVLDQKHYWSLF